MSALTLAYRGPAAPLPPAARAALFARATMTDDAVRARVAEQLAAVRVEGDDALRRFAATFDGVDVLTLSTAGDAPDADVNVAHWVKLPRRERTLTLVHRAEGPTGPVETVLGTWPPLR